MAKVQDINNAFLTTKSKNDVEVEKATKRNINRIDDNDVFEIHNNLMKVLNIKSNNESKYFDINSFKDLIKEIRENKLIAEEKKKQKLEEQNFGS
jgi:hypothetical protein